MKRYKVSLLPSAYEDIKQARRWYIQHSRTLPKQFTKHLQASIKNIGENPFAYAERYKEVHIANLKVFPYAIHYIIDEKVSEVVILAVHHTALSPDKWQKRLKR